MKKLRCLIVEDEPLAAEVLQDYISQIRQLELVGVCEDAIFAMEALRKQPKIDVVFLDIHLPKIKGLDFIKALKNPPQIIITTAYHQYALDGFDLAVVDYLLKPIEFSRFLQAVNKLKPKAGPSGKRGGGAKDRAFRFFNVKKKKVKVYLDEILYIESRKDYVKIHTPEQCLTTKFQLGELEGILEEAKLLRIHRSFLVSKGHITAFSATEIEIAEQKLPIGRSYKETVFKVLDI